MTGKTAVLAGATGLVGSQLLPLLLDATDYAQVVVLSRRPLDLIHPKLKVVLVAFDRPQTWGEELTCDDFFCSLGTTLKRAGSREAFRAVDYGLVVALANAVAQRNPTAQAIVVSALGADPDSRFYYNRVKGDMERDVAGLPLTTTVFLRPSLLSGPRTDFRLGERLGLVAARLFGWALLGPLRKYRAIPARQVARAMLIAAQLDGTGNQTIESDDIAAMALRDGRGSFKEA